MQVNSAIAQNASIEKLKHARIWTSTNGKKMRASFVKIDGYDIVLARADTLKEVSVPQNLLSAADIQHIGKKYSDQISPKLTGKAIPSKCRNKREWRDGRGDAFEDSIRKLDNGIVYFKSKKQLSYRVLDEESKSWLQIHFPLWVLSLPQDNYISKDSNHAGLRNELHEFVASNQHVHTNSTMLSPGEFACLIENGKRTFVPLLELERKPENRGCWIKPISNDRISWSDFLAFNSGGQFGGGNYECYWFLSDPKQLAQIKSELFGQSPSSKEKPITYSYNGRERQITPLFLKTRLYVGEGFYSRSRYQPNTRDGVNVKAARTVFPFGVKLEPIDKNSFRYVRGFRGGHSTGSRFAKMFLDAGVDFHNMTFSKRYGDESAFLVNYKVNDNAKAVETFDTFELYRVKNLAETNISELAQAFDFLGSQTGVLSLIFTESVQKNTINGAISKSWNEKNTVTSLSKLTNIFLDGSVEFQVPYPKPQSGGTIVPKEKLARNRIQEWKKMTRLRKGFEGIGLRYSSGAVHVVEFPDSRFVYSPEYHAYVHEPEMGSSFFNSSHHSVQHAPDGAVDRYIKYLEEGGIPYDWKASTSEESESFIASITPRPKSTEPAYTVADYVAAGTLAVGLYKLFKNNPKPEDLSGFQIGDRVGPRTLARGAGWRGVIIHPYAGGKSFRIKLTRFGGEYTKYRYEIGQSFDEIGSALQKRSD